MSSQFRATTPDDFERIAELSARIFGLEKGHPFLDRAFQDWKYWRPWEGEPASRSYVIEKNGRFVAHGCAWPMRVLSTERSWSGIYLIDWAADTSVPGMGVVLLKHMAAGVDFVCAIGGTEQTRAIMPKLGFQPFNEMQFVARPLRPMRQILTHQHRDWKLPLRLARNTLWRYWPLWPGAGKWTATPISPLALAEETWPRPSPGSLVGARWPGLFEHLLACPVVPFRFYRLSHDGNERGYFCLSFAPGQARIADLWVNGDLESWTSACALAMREALRDSGVAEIESAASSNVMREALARCGFRVYDRWPIGFRGGENFLASGESFALQMIDADFAFVLEKGPEYRT